MYFRRMLPVCFLLSSVHPFSELILSQLNQQIRAHQRKANPKKKKRSRLHLLCQRKTRDHQNEEMFCANLRAPFNRPGNTGIRAVFAKSTVMSQGKSYNCRQL